MLTRLPGAGTRALKASYSGEAEPAEHLLKPLFEVAGQVLAGELKTTRYGESAMGGTPARYLDLVDTLPDDLLDELAQLTDDTAPTVEIRQRGGAMAHPGPGAGPVGHREATYSLIIDQELPGPAPVLRNTSRTFLNSLADPSRATSAYAETDLARPRAVKRATTRTTSST